MDSFWNTFNIKAKILRRRTDRFQLNLYYPKEIYEPLARKEMKMILGHFNDVFYQAYPDMLENSFETMVDYHPKSHARQDDIQRAIKLCKSQKVRRKDLVKIEEYLNLQYIIELQLTYYHQSLQKAVATKTLLAENDFSSFFPQLFKERIESVEQRESYSQMKIKKLDGEKRMCEKAIHDLMKNEYSFWGDAGQLIRGMVAESIKQVADIVEQSIRRK